MRNKYSDRIVGTVSECRCTRCQKIKPVQEFSIRSYAVDNNLVQIYYWYCNDCIKDKKHERWHKNTGNPIRRIDQIKCDTLPCKVCGKEKPLNEFTIFTRFGFRFYSYKCNECRENQEEVKSIEPAPCQECIHYSVLRKKCKIHKYTKKCKDFDDYLYTNIEIDVNNFIPKTLS